MVRRSVDLREITVIVLHKTYNEAAREAAFARF